MLEDYTKSAVEKFQSTPSEIPKDHLRHYSQTTVRFDDSAVLRVLNKFKIPLNSHVTVYGGYTGQFAECLRRIGMQVVFTDPLEEWVENASSKNFEAHCLSVQQIPKDLLARTDLFASFECYPDLIGESEFVYPFMRFLTAPSGVFFVESKRTVANMRREDGDAGQKLGSFRRHFRPLRRVYGIQGKATKSDIFNFYHIFANAETRMLISYDIRILKAMFDNFKQDYRVTRKDIPSLSTLSNLNQSLVESSIGRLADLSESINAPFVKSMPSLEELVEGSFHLGSKRFYFTNS
jgi:hypothetical protein